MIEPTFEIKGLTLRAAAVKRAVRNASIAPEAKAALLVEREAKASMKKGGVRAVGERKRGAGGRFLKMARARVVAPAGEPPYVQRGALRASITHAKDGWSYVVGATEPYAKVHEQDGIPGGWAEFGGRRYPARPFMRPALERVARNLPQLWRNLKLKRHDTGT